MDFFTHVDAAQELLRRHGRVSRRGLIREFGDDELVAEIIDELVVRGVARVDADVVQWIDGADDSDTAPSAPSRPDVLPDGEIRNLTVLFFDTVGSTQLSEEVSSEDWSEAMRASLEMATASIEEFGGHVGGYMGDGLIAYFGYPKAQEDAPERAVRAGLSILDAVVDLNESGRLAIDRQLAVRVGIHTGPVVLDQVAGTTQAMGRTANLAARLESVAPTNSVVMSGETRRFVAGIFVTEDLGTRELKGFVDPVSVTRVTAVGGLARRAGRASTTPLFGRAGDLDRMRDCWDRATGGSGGVIEITGEAGVGKSSLVDAFRDTLIDVGHSWLDSICTPLARSSPLFPIADLQARGLGFDFDTTAEDKRVAIAAHMSNIGLDPDRAVHLLTSLHGLDDDAPPTQDAALQRVELFDFMLDWIATLARRQPTVLLLEDLHWADPTTLDFVERLASRSLREPLLVVLTSRPERDRALHAELPVTRFELARLDPDESRAIIRSITGDALDPGLVDSIVGRADGVPLFLEELADAAIRNPEGFEVPATIQNVLMARLDAVRGVRPVARAASIIGREFTLADLELVLDQPETDWRADLDHGVQHGVFFERHAASGTTEFVFKHSLMRDAVYDSMLRRDRSRFHLALARGIAGRRPMLADRRPDLVAEHLAAAGHGPDASVWWERAAEQADRTASAREAERFYRKALESADEHDLRRRVELEVARAGALSNILGFGDAELETTWSSILEHAAEGAFDQHRAVGHTVLATTVCQRDIAEARRLAAIAEAIARDGTMPEVEIGLDAFEVMLGFYEGRPLDAIDLSERRLTTEPGATGGIDRGLGVAVVPLIHGFRGEALASTGRYRAARAAHERATQMAAPMGPSTQTLLIPIAASSPIQRDDIERFAELSDHFQEQARRYDLGYSIITGELQSVAAHLILEPDERGLDRLDDLQARLAHGGRVLAVPIFAWILARARQSCGHLEVADGTAAVAQAIAESTGQRWLDGHLCAFRLELAEQMGQLAPDWFDATQPVFDFLRSRSLNTGALYLAAQRRVLAGDGAHAETAAVQLAEAYASIEEPDDSPLLVRARGLLGA